MRVALPPVSMRFAGRAVVLAAVAFALVWVLFAARNTNFGPAVSDPRNFFVTLLNGLTFAGLLFVVASGFSLIFGLMRVVNMAHGSFFLLGGYIAWRIQQDMAGGTGFTIAPQAVNTWQWVLPALAAAGSIALIGLVVQQAFLRWNQGQDLRQALITIAISVIIADQVVHHFGGTARSITWPGWTNRLVDLHVFDLQYSLARLVLLFFGIVVGLALWLWLYRTRTGMIIRAGVDDREMTSALGINIYVTFAIAFVVGSALAAFGGAVGASQGGIGPGQDGQWLLNSLVVVIIGGMGTLVGAVAGALLYGLVFSFASVYLPAGGTQYSIVVTFVLLALVLAFRPQGLFGRVA